VKPVYLLRPFFFGDGMTSSMVSARVGKLFRAMAVIAGAVSDGRFFGVLLGVGRRALLRIPAIDRLGSILLSGLGVGRPRAVAADAVLSWSNAPEIRRPLIKGEVLGVRFFGAVGGDEGGEEVVAVGLAFLEDLDG
jgi:hypothetical protein